MQRINDIGGQTVVKKKSEKVVTVMSCSLKSYFYFATVNTCTGIYVKGERT